MASGPNVNGGAGGRVNIVVPIHDRSVDLNRVVADLRAAGMTIRHVFDDLTVRKVTGDVAPDSLPEVRKVGGIGSPRLEKSFTIEPPKTGSRGAAGPGLA